MKKIYYAGLIVVGLGLFGLFLWRRYFVVGAFALLFVDTYKYSPLPWWILIPAAIAVIAGLGYLVSGPTNPYFNISKPKKRKW